MQWYFRSFALKWIFFLLVPLFRFPNSERIIPHQFISFCHCYGFRIQRNYSLWTLLRSKNVVAHDDEYDAPSLLIVQSDTTLWAVCSLGIYTGNCAQNFSIKKCLFLAADWFIAEIIEFSDSWLSNGCINLENKHTQFQLYFISKRYLLNLSSFYAFY